jgi:outer membrane lipoprotein-sorting protein
VKTFGLIVLITTLLLFSCLPKKPGPPMTAVPAGPLLKALEQHRQSFASLKAVARVDVIKRGRKRSLDTVGIVIDRERRLRMEAYGPLGQSLMAVVWDGQDVLLRLPGEEKATRSGPAGLEKLFGKGLEPSELCAVLSGNIPETAPSSTATLLCAQEQDCTLELRDGNMIRRVLLKYPTSGSNQEIRIFSEELYQAGKLVYEIQFERTQEIAHYRLPLSIVLENPDKKLHIMIQYTDAEVNTPLSEESFVLSDEAGTEISKPR